MRSPVRVPAVPALPLVLALLAGCQTAPKNEVDVNALLAEREGRAYLSGTIVGLGEPNVVNNKDFIYAVAFNERTRELAFVHHVTTFMELTLAGLDPVERRFQIPVNHHEFDVEDVVFVEREGQRFLATPSRQGTARRFDAATGEPRGEFIFGHPLIRVAVNPSQTLLAFGSSDGRVLVLDADTLAFRGEARPHADEVHGLVFVDDGTLLSTGFDGQLVELAIEPGAPEVIRVSSTEAGEGARAFLSHLDGTRAVATMRDVRQPHNVITQAAVRRLGLATVEGGASLPAVGPLGMTPSPVVELGDVQIRSLSLGRMRAAVCDACVPPGVELVLGQESLRRVALGEDLANSEVLVKPGTTPGLPPVESAPVESAPVESAPVESAPVESAPVESAPVVAQRIPGALLLREVRRIALPGPGTDIDVDALRRKALVTYSHARAVRSVEIYEAEKKGIFPPPSPASGAVLVDLGTFELGRRFIGHRGFTVTGALSPDGGTVATGGWDERLLVFDVETGKLVTERKLAWLLRRVRFSPDGRLLAAAAWTPASAVGDGSSEPALLLYPVVFSDPRATGGARAADASAR